jgi:two-component system cell cycle sensor histidine kinase/response regulator CckA
MTPDLPNLLDSLDVIAWEAEGLPRRFTFVSAYAERLLGQPRERWLSGSEGWHALVHPADRKRIASEEEQAAASSDAYVLEYRVEASDGKTHWLRDSVRVVERGTPLRLRGSMVEITAEKAAAAELDLRDRWAAALAENADEGISLLDAEGTLFYVSGAAARLMRMPPAELVGRRPTEFVRPDSLEATEATLREVLSAPDRVVTGVYCVLRGDGTPCWLEVTAANRLHDPAIRAIVANFHDVTAQRDAERMLLRVASGARCLLWHGEMAETGEPFLAWKGSVLSDEAAQRVLPLEVGPGQEYVEAFYNSILPQDRDRMDRFAHARVRAGEDYQQEYRCRRSDGAVRWLQEVVNVEPAGPGRWRAVGVCIDITERKQAEAELRESEEQLALALRSARMAPWHWDVVTDCLSGPRELSALFGLPAELRVGDGESALDLVHPDDRAELELQVDACSETGTDFAAEFRIPLASGAVRWLRAVGQVQRDPDGRARRMSGVAWDISARKQAEERLRHLTTHARCLLWQATVREAEADSFYWEFEPIDEEASQRFFPLNVPPGMTYSDAAHHSRVPEDRQRMHANYVRAFRSGAGGYDQEFRATNRHGDLRWHHEQASIEPVAPGVWRVTGVVTDITELKRAQEALEQISSRVRCLLWHAAVRLEADGELLWDLEMPDAEAAERFLPLERAPGERYEDAWYRHRVDEDRERTDVDARAALVEGRPDYSQEFRCRRKDGEVRWLQEHAQIEPLGPGRWRVVGVCTDITERKQLEEQLRQAQKMEAVGRLAGGVAHDFNNMLAVINGYSELLLDRFRASDPTHAFITEIKKAGERAAALTRQLLAFSRKQIIAPQILDLDDLVTGTHGMLRRLIREDIELVTIPSHAPSFVRVDPAQIDQVLVNLAVNARDAMPGGGKLLIRVDAFRVPVPRTGSPDTVPAGDYVMLEIGDTGIGMDAATLGHIFEPFFTTKAVGEGTGLGLATVYGTIKQSEGYVEVESSPGHGTTFRLFFPQVAALPGRDDHAAARPRRHGTETVLLAEDEEMLRRLLADVLRDHGYRILEARNGHEAVRIAGEHPGPIHLLITDAVMPGMGGHELAERLTGLRPEMAVLLMSGYTEDALVRRAVSTRAAEFLQKPFSPLALTERVRTILDT